MRASFPRDGAEVQVHVRHVGDSFPPELLVDVNKLSATPKALRLLDLVYAVESPGKVRLWWEDKGDQHVLLLPLEGRGRLDCGPLGGLSNPKHEGWSGHVLISFECNADSGAFFLALEFAKERA